MKCPKCKHVQQTTVECESCGIVFAKYYAFLAKKKFEQAVQKYHAQEYDAALEIFNAIVSANIPKDEGLVKECEKYIFLIKCNSEQETIPVEVNRADFLVRNNQASGGTEPVKMPFPFNAILLINLSVALTVALIVLLATAIFSLASVYHGLGSGAGGLGFLFIFLVMIPGLPWSALLSGYFYPGATGPSSYFLNALMLLTPVFINATLVGSTIELIFRAKATRQGRPIRTWGNKEFWGTWLVILTILSGYGYINFWFYQSSLAWRKANPEVAYRLSHPEAQRKYMAKIRQRTAARIRKKREAIRRRAQAAKPIEIPNRFTSIYLTKKNIVSELNTCVPEFHTNSQAFRNQLQKFPSNEIVGFSNLSSNKIFAMHQSTAVCLEKSPEGFAVFAPEEFTRTVNPRGVSPVVADQLYKKIALLIATKGVAKVAYISNNGNAFITKYWVKKSPHFALSYSSTYKKAGYWESEKLDVRFSNPSMTSVSETKRSGLNQKKFPLDPR